MFDILLYRIFQQQWKTPTPIPKNGMWGGPEKHCVIDKRNHIAACHEIASQTHVTFQHVCATHQCKHKLWFYISTVKSLYQPSKLLVRGMHKSTLQAKTKIIYKHPPKYLGNQLSFTSTIQLGSLYTWTVVTTCHREYEKYQLMIKKNELEVSYDPMIRFEEIGTWLNFINVTYSKA